MEIFLILEIGDWTLDIQKKIYILKNSGGLWRLDIGDWRLELFLILDVGLWTLDIQKKIDFEELWWTLEIGLWRLEIGIIFDIGRWIMDIGHSKKNRF